jgi:hypothetical protein
MRKQKAQYQILNLEEKANPEQQMCDVGYAM